MPSAVVNPFKAALSNLFPAPTLWLLSRPSCGAQNEVQLYLKLSSLFPQPRFYRFYEKPEMVEAGATMLNDLRGWLTQLESVI